jgi:hypothetical protein
LAEPAETIDVAEMLASVPHRIHDVMDRYAKASPDQPALVEDSVTSGPATG